MDEECERVIALELRLLDPEVRGDPTSVMALLHPDYVEFGTSGRVWTGTTMVEALAAEDDRIEAAEMTAVKLSPTVVLLTYRARRPSRATLRSSIWTRTANGWLMRFHQGTAVPE